MPCGSTKQCSSMPAWHWKAAQGHVQTICACAVAWLLAEQLPGGSQEQCSRRVQAASLAAGCREPMYAVVCLPSV